MLNKTRGIVLNFFHYRDTSIITKIYTETFGIQSYIVNNVRTGSNKNKKNKAKIAFFQPLTLLDLVVYHRKNSNINRIAELQCSTPFKSIPYDHKKSSIVIFLAEVLYKSLREEESNLPLFDFIWHSLSNLDGYSAGFENFHLEFLLQLAGYLGFAPTSGRQITDQIAPHLVTPEINGNREEKILDSLINNPGQESTRMNRNLRTQVLETIIRFYQLHMENFGELKSLHVLREVMH